MKKAHATWVVIAFILGSSFILPAQETESAIEAEPLSLTPADVAAFPTLSEAQAAALVSALEATPTIPVESGTLGTFYSLQHPEWPPLPADLSGSSVWSFGTFCLLSDLNYSYQAAAGVSLMKSGKMQAMTLDIPSPEDGGDTNGYGTYESSYTPADYGTNLWLSITHVAGSVADLVLSNTLPDVPYEIQANADIARTNWIFAGWVYGSDETNWTPVSVAATNDPALFYRVRSWEDDGSGLPVWWQQQYGVSDPYGDPDGDGWNNLQELHNWTDPTLFNTPPTPQGLTATYNVSDGTADIAWLPSSGPVTGYTVEDSDSDTYDFLAGTNNFNYDLSAYEPDPYNYGNLDAAVRIQAHYAGGDSGWSEWVPVTKGTINASIVAGPLGMAYVAVSGLPPGTSAIRLTEIQVNYPYTILTNFDIPISSFTNGLCPLQNYMSPGGGNSGQYYWYGQAVGTDGHGLTAATFLSADYASPYDGNGWLVPPYFDGRVQLKENLIFQLRAATADSPFQYTEFYSPVIASFFVTSPTNYAYAGLYNFERENQAGEILQHFDIFQPFEENYLDRNFVFNTSDLDTSGRMNTGIGGYTGELFLNMPPVYQFPTPTTNGTSISSVLATNLTQWLCSYAFDSSDNYLNEIGITNISPGLPPTYVMYSNARNFFGLTNLSAKIGFSGPNTITLNAGGNTTQTGYFYPETAQPQFQLAGYDVWTAPEFYSGTVSNGSDFPGMAGLSASHTNAVQITSVGNPDFQIVCYAKLAVQNGYSGVFAYLGQYFDQAYKITNGIVTTNTTGVLSPYGSFFATEPGTAALVTMPDLDTGERGTATVYCVSLQLDKNHDGVMDLNFNGADATSQASPMVFWVNNDSDWSYYNGDVGKDVVTPPNGGDYLNQNISSQRDLEDWARLWICGVPALTNAGYEVSLSWNVSSGSPAVNLVQSVETDGGTLYLTDTNIAAAQTSGSTSSDPSYKFARVTPGQAYTFPASYFTNSGNKYLLFEGAGIGSGELVLTISQNGNVIAQTGLWLDLHDAKDLYEQARATNVTSGLPPSSLVSQYTIIHPSSGLPDETKQVIIHIHGMNVSDTQWKVERDTIFKRLYWSGYHGRFASLKWPCAYLPFENSINPFNYNLSEFYAWKSATAFKDYLCYLTNRADLAGYSLNILAHSQGNIVVGEAIHQGAPFDNYILTQAAAPAHAYDMNAPFLQNLLDADAATHTPLYPTNGGYHGYFANLNAHGRLINFFNTNDFALATGVYLGHQANWVADQETQKPENFLYRLGPEYTYFPSSGVSLRTFILDYNVTDQHEIMSMVARSRSAPVGAQGGLGGAIGSSIDLRVALDFKETREEHSAQISRPIQTAWEYYDQVLRSFQLQPINR